MKTGTVVMEEREENIDVHVGAIYSIVMVQNSWGTLLLLLSSCTSKKRVHQDFDTEGVERQCKKLSLVFPWAYNNTDSKADQEFS